MTPSAKNQGRQVRAHHHHAIITYFIEKLVTKFTYYRYCQKPRFPYRKRTWLSRLGLALGDPQALITQVCRPLHYEEQTKKMESIHS